MKNKLNTKIIKAKDEVGLRMWYHTEQTHGMLLEKNCT